MPKFQVGTPVVIVGGPEGLHGRRGTIAKWLCSVPAVTYMVQIEGRPEPRRYYEDQLKGVA